MKKLLILGLLGLFGPRADAVMTYSATNMPRQIGTYFCSYYTTNNANVASMLLVTTNSLGMVPTAGGATWDFSQWLQTNATVLRTDFVDPANATDGGDFPDATYAEQDSEVTLTDTNLAGWRFYSVTNAGRYYYGLYTPSTDADGLAVFDPPTVDIPATVTNGQHWERSTAWESTVDEIFPVYYEFSDQATVDAFGTVVLPNLGAYTTWRVHEVHSYTGLLYGTYTYEIVTNQYYYWLVPGLGVAVEITLYGNNAVYPGTLPFTNSVRQMCLASYVAAPATVFYNPTNSDLRVQIQGGSVVLNWNLTNSTSYQVQAKGNLSGTNWQVLGLTSQTNWTDALSTTQRYYRVVGLP